ncbi:Predicted PurR-regulated permease PerM [Micromonospora echinaurantiaca]|uniref:Predicted PurR-regulated permease PerM n=1 Tax=Micromonospora echinaurantiaca TaxID=47857 RepID=A0A1C5GUJ9_9ACTN|nr:AI-2E family transporter [Micromonospora echinaurantiaca]SCG37445.1 Predicted PurR-regulated permease PerM [Micromonospora echinaurantiaca]
MAQGEPTTHGPDPERPEASRPGAEPDRPGTSAPAREPSGPDATPEEGSRAGSDDDPPVYTASGRFGRPGRPLRRNSFLVGFTGALGALLAYTVYLGLRNAAGILVLVVIALFLAVGLNPAVLRLRRFGLPRGLAVAVVALTVLLLLCGGVVALVPPIVTQSGQFIEQLPSYVEALRRNQTVNDLVERYDVMERVQGAANAETVGRALGGVLGGAQLIFGTIFRALTVLVLTIYFLVYFDKLRALGYAVVPASRRERVRLIGDEILTKVGAYMVGALSIAVLAGVSTFVFALIAGLPYPFALAVVVAVADLIPQIGATLGAVIVSLVGFATDLPVGIACVVFFVIYQQVENYLIYPKIMRRSVEVNEVAALVAALLGVALMGVVGALLAIPLVAAVQLILREVVLPRQQSR